MASASFEPFLDGVIDRWRDAGVAYNGPALDGKPAPGPPLDLERLLLDTSRAMRHVARLYNTTATWLHDFGDLVAKHRLRRLIGDELAIVKAKTGQIGTRWRIYIDDEPLRPKVLRPASWIMRRHPDFVLRADFKGDLRASVMASLAFDEGACESELALARAAGGSRAQIRKALDNLEMTGRVRRHRSKAGTRIELLKFK